MTEGQVTCLIGGVLLSLLLLKHILAYYYYKQDQKRIIKDGEPKETKYKIRCEKCGCEFVFTESDWDIGFMEVESKVSCPCCGRRFYPSNRKVISDESYNEIIKK